MRSGLLVQTSVPDASRTSINKSPVDVQRSPSIVFTHSPACMVNAGGSLSTGRFEVRENVPLILCDGLPHLSSPLKPSVNGSPRLRSVGTTAL